MGKELKGFQMNQRIRVTIRQVFFTDKENINGIMNRCTRGNGGMEKDMDLEHGVIPKETPTPENGGWVTPMALEFTHRVPESMRESSKLP